MAPATPAPRTKSLFAALTTASVSISVRSPCCMTILSANGFMSDSLRFPCRLGLFLSGSWLRVIVDAAARFAAQAPLLHILSQQGIGTILLAERAMQILKDIEPHVEPHKIHQFKRTHRMIEAQL